MALEIIDGVYQIRTASDFIEFRDSSASTTTKRRAVQLADIDLEAYTLSKEHRLFEVVYDGRGYIINNAKGGAIFGSASGEFTNVHARNAHMYLPTTYSSGKGLGGFISAQARRNDILVMRSCSFEGRVSTLSVTDAVGGLVGAAVDYQSITLEDCHYQGDVADSSRGRNPAGGLIGSLTSGIISKCSVGEGLISKFDGTGSLGGLVGAIEKDSALTTVQITDCASSANVDGGTFTGGLIGTAAGVMGSNPEAKVKITRCYSEGVIKTRQFGAGLVGAGNYLDIRDCFALSPTISNTSSNLYNLSDIIARIATSGTVDLENNTALDTIEFLGA